MRLQLLAVLLAMTMVSTQQWTLVGGFKQQQESQHLDSTETLSYRIRGPDAIDNPVLEKRRLQKGSKGIPVLGALTGDQYALASKGQKAVGSENGALAGMPSRHYSTDEAQPASAKAGKQQSVSTARGDEEGLTAKGSVQYEENSNSKVNKKAKTSKANKSDHTKLSKASKGEQNAPPTFSPVVPPDGDTESSDDSSSDFESTSPPANGTPTSPPFEGGSEVRSLSRYALAYTTTEDRIPFRSEYTEAVEITRRYLSRFMEDQFETNPTTFLSEFLTVLVDNSDDFGEAIQVDFESAAVFQQDSTSVPTVEMLDRTLSSAFTGENLNGYLGLLQALPGQNVFSTTVFVNQTETASDNSETIVRSSPSTSDGGRLFTATGVIAGATGLAFVAAAAIYVRGEYKHGALSEDNFGKENEDCGTLAGLTVAGQTLDGEESFHEECQVQFIPDGSERRASITSLGTGNDDDDVTSVALELDHMISSPVTTHQT